MNRPLLFQKEHNYRLYGEYEELLVGKKGFSFLGYGSFRRTFRRGNVVVKIPRSNWGLLDNVCEAYAYRTYRKFACEQEFVFAPCRLLSNGCLMMAYVKPVKENQLPAWAHRIDKAQCGEFQGRIVVYDSGGDSRWLEKDAIDWAGITI